MKQLFVTYNTEKKKREERQDIFKCCERKEVKIAFDVSSTATNTQETLTNVTLNSSASSTTNSSTDSPKFSFNIFSQESPISVNSNLSVNSNINSNCSKISNSNQFLGKKCKIHFDVVKKEDSKTTNINNATNFTSSNSQSIDGTLINKDLEKSESLELSEDKNINNNDSDNKMKIMDDNDNKGNFYFLNEGRWSYKEHIKFIEAIAEFGKNWKDVQKYVGSRSSTQARSHAQKFFLKLKAIKTSKFDFDFSSNNIKSLSDIIEIIKRKDEYLKRGKEYIISTLISLSESISIENNDLCNNFKKKIKKIKKDEHSQNIIIDNKKNKNDLFNVFTDNNGNSEKDKSTANNIELNIINSENKEKKINTNIIIENKNESKNTKSENIKEEKIEKEIETNKIRESDNNIKNTDSYTIKGNIQNNQNPVIYDDYFYEQKQPKYLFEDGIIYLSDNSEFFNLNDISLILKENNSIRNSELPYVIFNNHFFS